MAIFDFLFDLLVPLVAVALYYGTSSRLGLSARHRRIAHIAIGTAVGGVTLRLIALTMAFSVHDHAEWGTSHNLMVVLAGVALVGTIVSYLGMIVLLWVWFKFRGATYFK